METVALSPFLARQMVFGKPKGFKELFSYFIFKWSSANKLYFIANCSIVDDIDNKEKQSLDPGKVCYHSPREPV